jgi:NhaP-type Na+/H+ or K+/H+ antiporter
MDQITITIMFMGALIFFAHFFNGIFDKTKIPNVLLLMIIGIAVGFFIDKEVFFGELGRVFTTITLIVILFESGTNLKFNELRSSVTSATAVTLYNFITTLIIVGGISYVFTPLNLTESIFMGAIVGGTSAAVVVPILNQLKLGKKASTVLLLESAFSDVLCLIVGLAALEAMKAGSLEIGSMMNTIWKSFLFAALIGIAAGLIWSLLLNLVRELKNSMFTTLAFVFLVYGIIESFGFNGGIGAMSLGIVLGNAASLHKTNVWKKVFRFDAAGLNNHEQNFYSEIVFILQTYFFVYVGVMIEFGSVSIYLLTILLMAMILLTRPLGVRWFVRKEVSVSDRTIMSIMSPKGLVPAVLASIPLQLGMSSGQTIAELGYSIVLISIVVSSILIMIGSKDPLAFVKLFRRGKISNESVTDEQYNGNKELDDNFDKESSDEIVKSNE